MQTFIHIIADGLMLPIVLIALFMLVFKIPASKRYESYKRVLLAGLTSYTTAKILGLLYQPETMRPFEKLGLDPGAAYLNNPGFPSDHALFAMFLVLAVWFTTKNKPVSIILLILALIVCVGRVLALVHTPLDVAGGILVALIGALAYRNFDAKSKV